MRSIKNCTVMERMYAYNNIKHLLGIRTMKNCTEKEWIETQNIII